GSIFFLSRQMDSRRFVPPLLTPAVLAHPGPPSGLRRTPTFSSSTVWRGVDVVKLPRGHRPLSPVPSATGHGHCPLVYPRGIRRTTREDESRALWVNTHAQDVVHIVRTLSRGIRVRPSPCKVYYVATETWIKISKIGLCLGVSPVVVCHSYRHVRPAILVEKQIPRRFHPVACALARSLAVTDTETLHCLQGRGCGGGGGGDDGGGGGGSGGVVGAVRHLREIHR
ncbi:hypothetical protein ALC62_09140, partial [Cyphomyrmex costatus]